MFFSLINFVFNNRHSMQWRFSNFNYVIITMNRWQPNVNYLQCIQLFEQWFGFWARYFCFHWRTIKWFGWSTIMTADCNKKFTRKLKPHTLEKQKMQKEKHLRTLCGKRVTIVRSVCTFIVIDYPPKVELKIFAFYRE